MAKIVLFFLLLFCAFLPFADLGISLNFTGELKTMFLGLVNPKLRSFSELLLACSRTIVIAVSGVCLAFTMGILLNPLQKYAWGRVGSTFIRAIHEMFWILLFIPFLGLSPLSAILGLAVPYTAMFSKLIFELSRPWQKQRQRLVGQVSLSSFFYLLLPKIISSLKSVFKFRLECGLRATTIMGFLGIPTLGFYLETAFAEGMYGHMWVLLFVFLICTYLCSWYVHKYLLPLILLSGLVLVYEGFFFSGHNLLTLLQEAFVPWPIKRFGSEEFGSVAAVLAWFLEFAQDKVLPGVGVTMVLTSMAVGLCFFISLIIIPFSSERLMPKWFSNTQLFKLFIWRNMPEYLIAALLLSLLGPSLLPAIIALAIHNAGIISHLSVLEMDELKTSAIRSKSGLVKYFYLYLPKIMKKVMLFTSFRWEFFIREATVLGFLGIHTLGFYADSAFHEQKFDDLVLILICIAGFNLIVAKAGEQLQKTLAN